MYTPLEKNQLLVSLEEIIAKTRYLNTLIKDDSQLYDALNKLSTSTLSKMADRYKGSSTPVNKLRETITFDLINGRRVRPTFVEALKQRLSPENQRVFVHYQKAFTLFFPFFIAEYPEVDVKGTLQVLINDLTFILQLDKTKFNIVDFNGSSNYGADWVWFAIYNASHPNQKTAKQFFVAIDRNGILCSFYDRPNDRHIQQQFFLPGELTMDVFTNFFGQHVDALKSDIYSNETQISTSRIYKLSHGENEITDEQYRYLLEQKKAIIYHYTPAMGKRTKSQGTDFEEAKIGDLFYLCRSNQKIELIGQFTGDIEPCEITQLGKNDWVQRSYRIIAESVPNKGYEGNEKKWWLPNFRSTFYQIPTEELQEAEHRLLKPFFKLSLEELFLMIDVDVFSDLSKEITHQQHSFITRDAHTSPILGLNKLVVPVADLLRSMQQEPGQMFGIFGEWGRGKTFFVRHLCKELGIDYEKTRVVEQKQLTTYHFAKFHAWKYQDSEAAWAYLYEIIAKTYFTHKNKVAWDEKKGVKRLTYLLMKRLNEMKLLIRLNIVRNGWKDFAITGFSIVLLITCGVIYAANEGNGIGTSIKNVVNAVFSTIGLALLPIPLYSFVRFFYNNYKLGGRGKQIIQRYTTKKNFFSAMGMQAEVQDELIYLLKAWFPNKKHEKQWHFDKLILFVDDLDRCDKDKIISIVDSLRVVLEDPEIAKRLVILVAVDEEKLSDAIAAKYGLSNAENEGQYSQRKKLIINYIDKLFITAIKLHDLQHFEKEKILFNYINNDQFVLKQREVSSDEKVTTQKQTSIRKNEQSNFDFSLEIDNVALMAKEVIETEKAVIFHEELTRLLEHMREQDVTPRKIRIILYRFLLAKYITYHHGIGLTEALEDFLAEWVTRRSFDPEIVIVFPSNNTFSEQESTIKKILDTIIAY